MAVSGDLKDKMWKLMYPNDNKDMNSDESDGADDGIFTERNVQTLKNIQVSKLRRFYPQCLDYYGLMVKVKGDTRSNNNNLKQNDSKMVTFDVESSSSDPVQDDDDVDVVDYTLPTHSSDTSPSLVTMNELYKYLAIMEDSKEVKDNVMEAQEHILDTLKDFYLLEDILTRSKGRMFICRLLNVIDCTHARKLFYYILKKLSSWNSECDEEEMTSIYSLLKNYVIKCEDADTMAGILGQIDLILLNTLASTRVGISVIMAVLYRGDQLYSLPVTCDFRKKLINWSSDAIQLMHCQIDENLPVPYEMFEDYLLNIFESSEHYLDTETKGCLREVTTYFVSNQTTPELA